jgi:DNA polymerase
MIVGEGPGTDEDARGKPFVGRAGEFLDEVLAKAGIDRWEVWITNTVRCRPVDLAGDRLRNRAPEAHEIKACEVWMAQEFRFTAPQAVICLGATSAHALISRDFLIGEGRGKWYSGRDGIPTTATYHPAYALRFDKLRRAEIESQMVNDFRAAIQLIQGG